MLTKDQLKYTVRADKVFPKYVKPNDAEALASANFLVHAYKSAKGQKLQILSENLKQHPKSSQILFQGLSKLLEDRCEYQDSDDAIECFRWEVFRKSKELRSTARLSAHDFQMAMATNFSMSQEGLEQRLYGDLPEFRVIDKFELIEPSDLIHRYNCSQIQGLLLRSRNMNIVVKDKDPIKRRRLLQRLKFWRLLAEVSESKEKLEITISGPLAMFDKSATYGSRLSYFFPNILLMEKWEITAEVKIDEKSLSLEVDSTKVIKSHYGDLKGHIPSEFKDFIHIFNDLPATDRKGYIAKEGEDVLNLGGQNYVVPDITFENEAGRRMHLELFHKWHESQLNQRVEALGLAKSTNLILGIAEDLMAKDKLKETQKNSKLNSQSMFTFKRFPTPKAIMAYLS